MSSSTDTNTEQALFEQNFEAETHSLASSMLTTNISGEEPSTDDQQDTDATSNPDSESGADENADEDADEDAEPDVKPDWKPVAFPFFREWSKTLSSTPAPAASTFAEHQRYWRDRFNGLLSNFEPTDISTQLTDPPTRKIEIEILDHAVLDLHGCGLHCPCDLDESRNVADKVFVLSCESGLTKGEVLRQLRDRVYGDDDERSYQWARDTFVGGLNFKQLNWMSYGHAPAMAYREGGRGEKLPCVFFEVDGKRRVVESTADKVKASDGCR